MKVVLILSLALAFLASVSFAGPTRVILPVYASEDLESAEKRETTGEEVEQNPFQAVEVPVDDGAQQKVVPLVSAFGLRKAQLLGMYELWLPKVPKGEDSSFQAFLDWMKEEENEEEEEGKEEKIEKEEKVEKEEKTGDEEKVADVERSIDEEEPQINRGEIAEGFGLTEAELEDLYRLWLSKAPLGEDSSFPAFVEWMKENDEPSSQIETRSWSKFQKWGGRIKNWFKKSKKEYVANDAEVQRSADEEQPQIDQQEVATITEDKRIIIDWFKRIDQAYKKKKKPRGLEEDQLQDVISGQLSMAERDLQPSKKPGPRSATSEDAGLKENVEDESREEIAADLGLTVAELEEVYRMWLPKVPLGQDSSFEAFTKWMKENDEPEDDDAAQIGSHFFRKVAKWGGKIIRWVKKIGGRELVEEEQRSDDEEQQQATQQELAENFGLTEAELEQLYLGWVPKVPVGQDTSFKAFISWMNENNEPEDDGAAEVVSEDKRSFASWFKKMDKVFTPRELEENPQQNSISDQGSVADLDLSPSLKPGSKTKDLDGHDLFEAYRNWLKTVPKDQDKKFQTFLKYFRNRKTRDLDNKETEKDDEKDEEQEKQKDVPVEEEKEKDKGKEKEDKDETASTDSNGGYSCEKNSPCNIENIANEEFYFATASSDKFIQCDAWGGCHTLTCEEGLVWDDKIKTCAIRT